MTDKYIPPAFPCEKDRYGDLNEGMSLRDYFAAKAVGTLITEIYRATGNGAPVKDDTHAFMLAADKAYAVADAMMKVREQ